MGAPLTTDGVRHPATFPRVPGSFRLTIHGDNLLIGCDHEKINEISDNAALGAVFLPRIRGGGCGHLASNGDPFSLFGTLCALYWASCPLEAVSIVVKGVKYMGKAVLYIRDEDLLGSLKNRLRERGFAEIIASGTPEELLSQALANHPEVAVIEFSTGDREISGTVKRLWEKLGLPIIMIAQSSDLEDVQTWGESAVSTILAKPVREEELVAALVLSIAAARRVERLKEEVTSLKESIESRKVIEKAKGRLMERDKLSEAEAFRRMQRLAMDRRISMRQLADAILLTDSIGG